MPYSVDLLTTAADCDQLLEQNADQLRTLRHRAASYEYQRENSTDTAAEVAAELLNVEGEITNLSNSIPTMPEGELKRKRMREKEIAEARRNTLRYRQGNQGAVAVLDRENDLAQVNAQIVEAEAFRVALEARRAAL